MQNFTRSNVIAAARSLHEARVPFRHQGRDAATGLDCSGLVLTSLRACGWVPLAPHLTDRVDYPEDVDDNVLLYSMQIEGRHIPLEAALPGDLVIFTWQGDTWPQHMGLVSRIRHARHYMLHSTAVGNQQGILEHRIAGHWRSIFHSAWELHGIFDDLTDLGDSV